MGLLTEKNLLQYLLNSIGRAEAFLRNDIQITILKKISEYEDGIVKFDEMLEINEKGNDPFFTRGRQEEPDFYLFLPILI